MSMDKGTDCFAASRLAMTGAGDEGRGTDCDAPLAMTENEPAEIRVAITYRMEKKKGEETAEDVLVVRLTRERMERLKRALSPDATLVEVGEAGLGPVALMLYSLAKMRGWDDAWIVDVREAEKA